MYALDSGAAFDPTDLSESLTPASFRSALAGGAFVRALLIALRLGDESLLRHGVLSVPLEQVSTVARALPGLYLEPVLRVLASLLGDSPHLEFLLRWLQAVAVAHGPALQQAGAAGAAGAAAAAVGGGARVGAPVLRALQQALARAHSDVAAAAEGNLYTLEYIVAASKAQSEARARAAEADAEDGGAAEGEGPGAGGGGANGGAQRQRGGGKAGGKAGGKRRVQRGAGDDGADG
ncbi:hypothetical protein Rsub_06358 [Raphidocelis subcapitata]|uniref:Small-subunit processome Utp12 domain-containing protein n=1 Tax=Raphidocelis subcapitata TaxID=307507 RepID=A0A2V0P188_9CHLO|nr:hypothetical protein Rsub_06358 [Raphidocelis subcapitata]|eukprot:GBF93636.1 hypothetical protein Rsub_06358 [Raphidocelis subcapitata]